ncbi:MAG: acyl--CoA ligase [Oligoflexia bacterium]|nr:acyl--CoA ligase [Oligoflexia bacterium]
MRDDLLIVVPPYIDSVDFFLKHLPSGNVCFEGDWDNGAHRNFLHRGVDNYPSAPLLGVFTTGTTRTRPKLVLYSKVNVTTTVNGIFSFFDVDRIKYIFCYPAPFHVFGLILGYFTSFFKNITLIAEEGEFTPIAHQRWLDVGIEDRKNMLTIGTPTHFKDLLYYVSKRDIVPTHSYSSVVGGAHVEKKLWHDLQKELKIEQPSIGYGCTEASLGVTHLGPGEIPSVDGDIGYIVPGINAEYLSGHGDADGFRILAPSLCLAMIEDDALIFPSEYIIKDKMDCTIISGKPKFHFKGRTQNLLNRGGEKFSLDQIELLLKEQLNIESVCLSIPHDRLGEELAILIQRPFLPDADQDQDQDQDLVNKIYYNLKNEYQKNFCAKNCFLVDEIPTNLNAKIDRHESKRIIERCLNSFQYPQP